MSYCPCHLHLLQFFALYVAVPSSFAYICCLRIWKGLMALCSQKLQCFALPSEPSSFVKNMKNCVETTFLQSALHARCWAVTLMKENPGGQRSSDISRAWSQVKFQSVLSVFGISQAKRNTSSCQCSPGFLLNGLIGFSWHVQRRETKAKSLLPVPT